MTNRIAPNKIYHFQFQDMIEKKMEDALLGLNHRISGLEGELLKEKERSQRALEVSLKKLTCSAVCWRISIQHWNMQLMERQVTTNYIRFTKEFLILAVQKTVQKTVSN